MLIYHRYTNKEISLPVGCPRDSVRKIVEYCAERGANLEGADLYGANLYGADLEGANLYGADLEDADLEGANLEGADLRGANLRVADLEGADLYGASLRGANLYGANLYGANLYGADLEGADLEGANLRVADLEGADLEGASLRGANFEGAYLRDANLEGANLEGADLRDANLRGADLRGANLRGAYLRDANFRGANLASTTLDPAAPVPPVTDDEITAAGLTVRVVKGRRRIYGWRTVRSRVFGPHEYRPHRWHRAPVFSVDRATACHPGIYLASLEWLRSAYGDDCAVVPCWAYADETVHAADKWRAKGIYVTGEVRTVCDAIAGE